MCYYESEQIHQLVSIPYRPRAFLHLQVKSKDLNELKEARATR